MIVNSIQDAALAIGVLQRQLRRLEARMQAFEAAAEPDAALASIDRMLSAQLSALEAAVAADLAGFEDEQPVRAVGNRQP